jgi:hypothetical protein
MEMERILDFLLKAKKATYAGKGPQTAASRPNSHDLEYAEGELKYIDTYLGGERFAGEEALWENGVPFWAMNYCGRVVGEGFDGNFLKEALSGVSADMPYRGPAIYEKGGLSYRCMAEGGFEWFNGREEIYCRGVMVYECIFHGGGVR